METEMKVAELWHCAKTALAMLRDKLFKERRDPTPEELRELEQHKDDVERFLLRLRLPPNSR